MIVSGKEIAGKSFDYVICGGGTAGLTIAARLSEDPNVSVLALEAGDANINDQRLLRTGSNGSHLAHERLVWAHQSTKQKHADDAQFMWFRGKGLGGSSGINFMDYTRPQAEDIDAFERLGNPGWNWKNYVKYVSRAEGFVEPSKDVQAKIGMNFDKCTLGRDGPVKVAYPSTLLDVNLLIQETFVNAGIPRAPNPNDGDLRGCFYVLKSIDPTTQTRSYATNAYYLPNKDRQNLTVVINAHVNRILSTSASASQKLRATGVEFDIEGKLHTVNANKEVIVCTGTLKSPQILELSGIGNKQVLDKIGVTVNVDLPGVGENVQEHVLAPFTYELRDDANLVTLDLLREPEHAAKHLELYESGTGLYTANFANFAFTSLKQIASSPQRFFSLLSAARSLAEQEGTEEKLAAEYRILAEGLEKGSVAACELIHVPTWIPGGPLPEPGKRYVSFGAAMTHWFSRGTIHSLSKDPHQVPEVDPHYFEQELDLEMWLEWAKFVRNLANVAPLKDVIAREINPGPAVDTDDKLRAWLKKSLQSTWHTAGSCSMLPRSKGGVVGPDLIVYGTQNIRVVDLSVIPLHVSCHTQGPVYAIAEQAADIIKGSFVP